MILVIFIFVLIIIIMINNSQTFVASSTSIEFTNLPNPVTNPAINPVINPTPHLDVYDKRVGHPQNIPVPAETLKQYSERLNHQFINVNQYNSQNRPFELNLVQSIKKYVSPSDIDYNTSRPLPNRDFFHPNMRNFDNTISPLSFVGSANSYAPIPEVITPWEKIGILTSIDKHKDDKHDPEILNLYRRPIAPLQDLWRFQVQDKNGFIIQLENTRYIENNDIIYHIDGKRGPYKAHIYVQNKYVWV